MVKLQPELLKNTIEEKTSLEINKVSENNLEEISKTEEYTTNFEEEIDLTEDEKKLRKNYLKKISKKEALYRSLILGKSALLIKIYSFITEMFQNIMDFKETKYKSDAINAITAKDLDKFKTSMKYLVLTILIFKIIHHFDIKIYTIISDKFNSKNIMLENFLFKKDIEFFDLYKTGELFNKVNEFEDYPYFNIIEVCTKFFSDFFKIIYFGYYLYNDYFEMGLIYSLLILLQNILEPYITSLYSLNDEEFDKREIKVNFINEILSNIRLIKSFGTEKKELKRINNIRAKIVNESFFHQLIHEFYISIIVINEIIVLYICGVKTISGKMNYGELLMFQKYAGDFSSALSNMKGTFMSINKGINDWINFLKYYDIDQKIISEKNIIPEEKDKKEEGLGIEFNKVSFSYPTKKNIEIIDNLNMKIQPGKNIAIVGSSGSGKTTLTNLLLRFYDVDKGEILIDGINIKDINLSWLRSKIGIVSQEPILTSGTIRENILYGVDNYTEKKFIEI